MKRSNNVHRSPITDDLAPASSTASSVSYIVILAVTFILLSAVVTVLSVTGSSDGTVPERIARVPFLYIFGASLILSAVINAILSLFRSSRRK